MTDGRDESLHELVGELLSILHDDKSRSEIAAEVDHLGQLHDEIEAAVAEVEVDTADEGVLGRLRSAIHRLEVAHPDATVLIGRISSALSELGI